MNTTQRMREGTIDQATQEIERKNTVRSSFCPCRYSTILTSLKHRFFVRYSLKKRGSAFLPRDLDFSILLKILFRVSFVCLLHVFFFRYEMNIWIT